MAGSTMLIIYKIIDNGRLDKLRWSSKRFSTLDGLCQLLFPSTKFLHLMVGSTTLTIYQVSFLDHKHSIYSLHLFAQLDFCINRNITLCLKCPVLWGLVSSMLQNYVSPDQIACQTFSEFKNNFYLPFQLSWNYSGLLPYCFDEITCQQSAQYCSIVN